MKTLLTSLTFFICAISFGQEIELTGKFGASFIGAETIEFIGKDSFYFSGFYCTYGVTGKGRCEIRNNYLYLYFEKTRSKQNVDLIKTPIIKKLQHNDSLAFVNITCVDYNERPIPYATIQLITNNKAMIGTIADSLGQSAFTIKKDDMPIVLEASAVGFENRQINIETYSSYNVRMFHKGGLIDKELNNGEVFIYEIEELSEDLILMRPEKSREQFRKYTKKM